MLRKKHVKPFRMIVASFLGLILVGALLLMLPISSRAHVFTEPLTAFFTATSATCVTGLIVVDTASYWSGFGQAVILVLIQIGGLGFMSVISLFFFVLRKHVGLRSRLMIMQSFNLDSLDGVVRFLRDVLIGTLCIEAVGALILSARFIPDYGFVGGIWRGVFHSISAFCNAGFDIVGVRNAVSGTMVYAHDSIVLLTLAVMFIIGGLGFFVWEDFIRKRNFRNLRIHSKMALITAAILLVGGMLLILIAEWNNSDTLSGLNFGEKLVNAFFQSATPRTAGFNSLDQAKLTDGGKAITILLMYIGAGGGSTAGGIKTVTVAVIFLSTLSTLRGKRDLIIFERKIENRQVTNAIAVLMSSLTLTLCGALIISMQEGIPFIQTIFETVSAFSTVGLSTGITAQLGGLSRIILIMLMYLGRIGVITFTVGLLFKAQEVSEVTYPTEGVMIG